MDRYATETVRAEHLAPGDVVLRIGLSGPAWCEVLDVQRIAVREFPGEVIWVEFAGAAPRRYVAGSTFARRFEAAEDDAA